ncbi:hypothetical protein FKM82_019289 [Ascaphus truei]
MCLGHWGIGEVCAEERGGRSVQRREGGGLCRAVEVRHRALSPPPICSAELQLRESRVTLCMEVGAVSGSLCMRPHIETQACGSLMSVAYKGLTRPDFPQVPARP